VIAEQEPPLWRNRDYVLLWTGNLISSIGSAMVLIALPLLVLAITGKALQTGTVAAAEAIPFIALSLPIGAVVDKYPRRGLLILAGGVAMLATALIPVTYYLHHLAIGIIYVVAVLVGCATALDQIAQVAVLPRLVGESRLAAASGQAELIYNVSAIAGPPLAGLLLSKGHLAVPFIVDSASFGVLVLAVGMIRSGLDSENTAETGRWREEIFIGFRKLAQHRNLRALSIMTLTGDFLFAGITVLMTVLLKFRGASAQTIGEAFAIAAAGGVIGSLSAARFERAIPLVPSVILRSWATALLFPLLATGIPPIALGFVWGLMNIMIAFMNVTQRRLTISLVPGDALGRTQAIVTFASFAVLPIGAVFTGVMLEFAGGRGTVLTFAGVLALVAIYSSVSRDLRTP
jgi:MFS family permease